MKNEKLVKQKIPKYCEYCGAELKVVEGDFFNIYTGERLKTYICPRIEALEADYERKDPKTFSEIVGAEYKSHTCFYNYDPNDDNN